MALNRTTLSEGGLISALLWASISNEKRYPVTLITNHGVSNSRCIDIMLITQMS